MANIIMMCGIPGSGKSTYVEEHRGEHDLHVSRDLIRFSMLLCIATTVISRRVKYSMYSLSRVLLILILLYTKKGGNHNDWT